MGRQHEFFPNFYSETASTKESNYRDLLHPLKQRGVERRSPNQECLKFLKEIQFAVSQDVFADQFNPSGDLSNLYSETSPIFLKVLQAHTGLIISSQLSDEVGKLTFMNTNSRMKSSGGTDSSPSDGYTDDIEAEANSYFDQMFSGQLTIDTMIQMLARFKESPENSAQNEQEKRSLLQRTISLLHCTVA